MPSSELTPTQYRALREQIHGIISEGKIHTRRSGEWEKVETYWHIGDALIPTLTASHAPSTAGK